MANASAMVDARVAVVTRKRPGSLAAPPKPAGKLPLPVSLFMPLFMARLSIRCAREQPARPQHQHNQEGDVAGKDLPFGIDVRADGLG